MKMGCLPASGNVSLIRTRFVCVCACRRPRPRAHFWSCCSVKKNTFHSSSLSLKIPVSWNYSKQANATISAELATWCKVVSISLSPSGAARLKLDESGSEAGQNIHCKYRKTRAGAKLTQKLWQFSAFDKTAIRPKAAKAHFSQTPGSCNMRACAAHVAHEHCTLSLDPKAWWSKACQEDSWSRKREHMLATSHIMNYWIFD